ncbi:hypothetical protein Rhe02_83630 [Rhizocola hellebori]|uniref:Transmembrane protein n=1 Tax=Rhizocola hellebori TaxID=1392758 RepID=A0A8J3QJI8_9ACTN|nr:hypothetical protein [Rhizocola hellebori]GIH10296.1 hypothetical protein Rhe02_83630 [Rhizocola hellebori]
MRKSSSRAGWFRSPGSAPVTLVATTVYTNYRRNAKVAFCVCTAVVGLLVAAILSATVHPILALFGGLTLGALVGSVAWAVARVWPVIRMVWWWTPELAVLIVFCSAFTMLAESTSVTVRVIVLALVIGVPAVIRPVRRFLVALVWCLIVRHRLRVCFSDVIKSNQHGSLPLILWARPTPIGERVWIFLRPGLSKADLVARLERLAVVCWATSVMVEQPGSNAAYLRIDIKRREVLTRKVKSPLVDQLPESAAEVKVQRSLIPNGLNLDEVPLVRYKPNSAKKPVQKDNGSAATTRQSMEEDDPWI